MSAKEIERAFEKLSQANHLMKEALESSSLEAFLENGENYLDNGKVRQTDGVPNHAVVSQLETCYQVVKEMTLSSEEMRKVLQLTLLQAEKEDQLQPNHQLTPDAIGFLFVYIAQQLLEEKAPVILDVAVGMGNLLLTVVLNLLQAGYAPHGVGVDIDETLLEVCGITSELTKADLQLFHQDGLQPLLIKPADLVISDLPVGYYPNDEAAAKFISASDSGHSFAHHLLIEQSMNEVKAGGFGLFLVPANLLESAQSSFFKKWLLKEIYLQGMIQLPKTLFRSEASQKSILILQKPGSESKQAQEVLIGEMTSLSDIQAVQTFFKQFQDWKMKNI